MKKQEVNEPIVLKKITYDECYTGLDKLASLYDRVFFKKDTTYFVDKKRHLEGPCLVKGIIRHPDGENVLDAPCLSYMNFLKTQGFDIFLLLVFDEKANLVDAYACERDSAVLAYYESASRYPTLREFVNTEGVYRVYDVFDIEAR